MKPSIDFNSIINSENLVLKTKLETAIKTLDYLHTGMTLVNTDVNDPVLKLIKTTLITLKEHSE